MLRGQPVPASALDLKAALVNMQLGSAMFLIFVDTGPEPTRPGPETWSSSSTGAGAGTGTGSRSATGGGAFLLLITNVCYASWETAAVGTLLSRPVWNGAALLSWHFDRIEGLYGASAVAVTADSSAVIVAAPLEARLTVFDLTPGAQAARLWPRALLPALDTGFGSVMGRFLGARRLVMLPNSTFPSFLTRPPPTAGLDAIAVYGGLAGGDSLCGPSPSVPPPGTPPPESLSYGCQTLRFQLTPLAASAAGLSSILWELPPTIDAAGTLSFKPALSQVLPFSPASRTYKRTHTG